MRNFNKSIIKIDFETCCLERENGCAIHLVVCGSILILYIDTKFVNILYELFFVLLYKFFEIVLVRTGKDNGLGRSTLTLCHTFGNIKRLIIKCRIFDYVFIRDEVFTCIKCK